MSAKVLTKQRRKSHIELLYAGLGRQAVHDVWSRCGGAAFPGSAHSKTNRREFLPLRAKPWRQKGHGRAPRAINHRSLARRWCGLWTKAARLFQESSNRVLRPLRSRGALIERSTTGDVPDIGSSPVKEARLKPSGSWSKKDWDARRILLVRIILMRTPTSRRATLSR